jgi:cysteinyl-tRNA synthetase
MPLTLYNTITRRKEPFKPISPGRVRMFVCGPTVYDYSHAGHAKTYTQFDLLARYLRHHHGYQLHYAQNLTDVDDKIIRRAAETGVTPAQLAERFTAAYLRDMAALHNTSVDTYARAHDHIDQIVTQIQQLIAGGHAYRLDDGWYYDLSTFPRYGALSGRTEAQPEDALARIDEHAGKRQPGDFALWKARKPGEPFWDTPLGPGRPGWHIEDTAITDTLFGAQYDLHGGAVDLIFPHHEAEIAQMEAASGRTPMVGHWVHTGFLRVGGDKMAKSAGNSTTLRGLLERHDYRTLRYAFLSQHYRTEMELTDAVLTDACGARRRVENFARLVDLDRAESEADAQLAAQTREKVFARLDDDLDTPGALGALFVYIREQNSTGRPPGRSAVQLLRDIDALFDSFDLDSHHEQADTNAATLIQAALTRRRALREAGQYTQADAIRADLAAQGIMIDDTADGTRWRRCAPGEIAG